MAGTERDIHSVLQGGMGLRKASPHFALCDCVARRSHNRGITAAEPPDDSGGAGAVPTYSLGAPYCFSRILRALLKHCGGSSCSKRVRISRSRASSAALTWLEQWA